MKNPSKSARSLRKALFALALLLVFLAIGLAAFNRTPWIIPAADKERQNPLTPSEANLTAAKQTYMDKCANCHGEGGKGDGSDAMMYDPTPSDLTDASKMSKRTDGEIYYQITQGRKPMPSFRNKLTEDQRWQLVMFVRSLAGRPAMPPPTKRPDVPGNKQPEPQNKSK